MNIDQYRALKEKEAQQEEGTQAIEQPEKVKEEEVKEEEVKEEPKLDEHKPEDNFVEINGEKIDLNELKNGYLRQSDYTKKTQKLASEKREIDDALNFYNEVKNNPDAIESLKKVVGIPRRIDPNQSQVQKLEEELYDMKLNNEIQLMQSKYDDFESMEILEFAASKNMTNLEDAYILHKSLKGTSNPKAKETNSLDIDKMKEELKKEIMAEMKSNNTSSIISSKQTSKVEDVNKIVLSKAEQKVAIGMGLSNKEYGKWRDANK